MLVRINTLSVDATAHHIIVIVEHLVTYEASRICIVRRLSKVIIDFDHRGRAPQLPKLQDFRKIEV
jgi:hypothetical protein